MDGRVPDYNDTGGPQLIAEAEFSPVKQVIWGQPLFELKKKRHGCTWRCTKFFYFYSFKICAEFVANFILETGRPDLEGNDDDSDRMMVIWRG